MAPFELELPPEVEGARPLLVEVPHAGLAVPEAISDELSAPGDAIMRDADIYVDKLYAGAPARGATLLSATVSRYVVDLNRARDDVDAATVSDHPAPAGVQPRGVVWRSTTDGRPVLTRPLSYERLLARLERYYAPYHAALERTLVQLRERFGHAIMLAGHSMPSMGRSLHSDPGSRRADVVPGSRGGTTCHPHVLELVDAHFREAGLSVRHDDPYKGGFSTTYYGRPREGWHAVQIELNRALYVDESTGEPREPEFTELSALLMALVDKLARLQLRG